MLIRRSMKKDIDKFREAIENNYTVILSGNCEVHYDGRAQSFLPAGDRLVIIKADNTLLVHQPEGNTPINYMKGNSSHKLVKEKDALYLHSQNLALKEYLDIKINKLHFMQTQKLEDGQKLVLQGNERDMSDMIYNNPSLIEKEFKPLSREEHTKFGFIDVFGFDKDKNLVVVECKRYHADFNAVQQLTRYVNKIKKSKGIENVRGILAAPKISQNALDMLYERKFEFRSINPPKFLERHNKDQMKLGDY